MQYIYCLIPSHDRINGREGFNVFLFLPVSIAKLDVVGLNRPGFDQGNPGRIKKARLNESWAGLIDAD